MACGFAQYAASYNEVDDEIGALHTEELALRGTASSTHGRIRV